MAAIFQDGCQTGLCFMVLLKNHSANCDINWKFGRSVPDRSAIQVKVLATKKNSTWRPFFQDGRQTGLCFLKNHSTNCDTKLKIWQGCSLQVCLQIQLLAVRKLNMAAIVSRWQSVPRSGSSLIRPSSGSSSIRSSSGSSSRRQHSN